MRRLAVIPALLAVATLSLTAQVPVNAPAFEVASVRQNTSASPASSISTTPGRLVVTNTPLGFIILHAFQVRAHELVGVPEWAWSDAYDITGTYPDGKTPTDAESGMMLRRLLEERFQLSVRREKREMPAYRLVVARADGRLGPQLVRSDVDCEKWIAEGRPPAAARQGGLAATGGQRAMCMLSANRRGVLTGGAQTIPQLGAALQSLLGRPVIDGTGLQGRFDMDLKWTPNAEISAPPPGVAVLSSDGPSLVTAVQEQLGLRLESTEAPFDVIVVNRLERPTPD